MKTLLGVFALLFLTSQAYTQTNAITPYSEVELQAATTDFNAVSIYNDYDYYTKSFRIFAHTLGQTQGHFVGGFYVMAEVYSGAAVIDAFSKQIANTYNGPLPAYTSFNTDYQIDYGSNTLIYNPYTLPYNATKIIYRVVTLNDPDMDGNIDSNDISVREYEVYL